MPDDTPGFFRSLSGLATDWVEAKRRNLATTTPQTNVDSSQGGTGYDFNGQQLTFEELRGIKEMRESGGQVAQLMMSKALLNFGEGAEFNIEDNGETETTVDGEPVTLEDWLGDQFPHIDRLVLDLGEDALWYPYCVGETIENRGGGFKEALPAEPWTLMPVTDDRGNVTKWRQQTKTGGGYRTQVLGPDDVWHIVLNKSSARDRTGISEVLRSKDEIQAFKENEQAINQAIELHGFPQRHVKVGKEDGAPVRDGDLRRVRNIFDPRTTDANTAYFTGQDVDVETLEAHQFDYQAIHEMDMRNLTTALGLPLEAGNVGSDGLGSGKPAELRFALLKLNIKANQRAFSTQFVEHVVMPVVEAYSPFEVEASQVNLRIEDPLHDLGEIADLIQKVGDYMTAEEVRSRLDLPAPEDDDVAESYQDPAQMEGGDSGSQGGGGLAGLLNSDGRELQSDVPAVTFQNVGGDPFTDRDALESFLEDLDDAAEYHVYIGRVPWPDIDDAPIHDRPVRAIGISESDAADVYEKHKEDAASLGGPKAVDDPVSLFMSEGDTDFRNLGIHDRDISHAPEWDRHLLKMHRAASDPETPTDRALVQYTDDATPEFVLERIREAIRSGALFSDFDGIPSDKLMDLRQEFADSLTADKGFSLDSLTDNLMDFEPDLTRDDAQRIARTESKAVLNTAREEGYKEKGDGDRKFYWSGAPLGDPRQTEACAWLIRQTNPFEGGDPVPMDELREMVGDAPEHDDEMDDNLARPDNWVVHPNERSSFVLAPEAGV